LSDIRSETEALNKTAKFLAELELNGSAHDSKLLSPEAFGSRRVTR